MKKLLAIKELPKKNYKCEFCGQTEVVEIYEVVSPKLGSYYDIIFDGTKFCCDNQLHDVTGLRFEPAMNHEKISKWIDTFIEVSDLKIKINF